VRLPEALSAPPMSSSQGVQRAAGDYWLKYFKGTREQDKTGNQVEPGRFGGQTTLGDTSAFPATGANNNFRSHLHSFGQHRPPSSIPISSKIRTRFPDVQEILDTFLILALPRPWALSGREPTSPLQHSGSTGTVYRSATGTRVRYRQGDLHVRANATCTRSKTIWPLRRAVRDVKRLSDNVGQRSATSNFPRAALSGQRWLQRKRPRPSREPFPHPRVRRNDNPVANMPPRKAAQRTAAWEIILSARNRSLSWLQSNRHTPDEIVQAAEIPARLGRRALAATG